MADSRTNASPNVLKRKSRFLMVVDSDVNNRAYLCSLLQQFKYPCFSATTAQEALETAITAVPLLILASLHLEDMDGYDFMRLLKENPKTADVPLIAISKQEDVSVRQRCLELGAVGCLHQPVSTASLYRVVQVATEKNPRASMRIRITQPVTVHDKRHGSLFEAYTLDLSEHGMFLRTVNPVSASSRLSLQLDLDGPLVPVEAEVLYHCTAGDEPYMEPGIGLKFTKIDPNDQERIRNFILYKVSQSLVEGNAHSKP